uniref:dUTP diphosphatase n=1 Tax=Geotrypetes seraphini TaxID=260995 RepID=A0A6P8R8H3_GEOSA|nr:uncharacterized protein LOC117357939 [Geotrypetes seraphini]
MDVKQLAAVMDAGRQQLTEDLRAVIRANQEIWRATQETAQHRHEELVKVLSTQFRTSNLGPVGGQTPMDASMPGAGVQSLVGPQPLQFLTLCKMGPQDAADDFLNTFERVATAAGWPESQWAVRLAPCLAGKAMSAYQTLNPEYVTNYNQVRTHILETLGLTKEYYRQQFRGSHMLEGERPKTLLQRLQRMAERWLQSCLTDVKALFAEILKEQFIEALPEMVRGWVKKLGGDELAQVVEATEHFMDATASYPGTESGAKTSRGAYMENEIRRIAAPGIVPKTLPNKRGGPKREVICYRCGKVGHLQRECRVRKEFSSQTTWGTGRRNQYLLKVTLEGHPVWALLDSGADQTLISSTYWRKIRGNKNPYQSQTPATIMCVHGITKSCPQHWLTVEYEGRRHSLLVAVIKDAPFTLLLGRDWPDLFRGLGIGGKKISRPQRRERPDPQVVMGVRTIHQRYKQQARRENKHPVLRYARMSAQARAPTQAYEGAAGYDVYAVQKEVIPPGGRSLVQTDLQVSPPPGTYLRVAPRSGLALRHAIHVGAGVIDPDYRGNLSVLLFNFGTEPFSIQTGDKVAQLVCERLCKPRLQEWPHLSPTLRGENGFGSSGMQGGAPEEVRKEVEGGSLGAVEARQLGPLQEQVRALQKEIEQFSHWKKEREAGEQEEDRDRAQEYPSSDPGSQQALKLLKEGTEECQRNFVQLQEASQVLREQVQALKEQFREKSGACPQAEMLAQQVASLQKDTERKGGQVAEVCQRWTMEQETREQQNTRLREIQAGLEKIQTGVGALAHRVETLEKMKIGELKDSLGALTERIEGLEHPEELGEGGFAESSEYPILNWPDDFQTGPPISMTNRGRRKKKGLTAIY